MRKLSSICIPLLLAAPGFAQQAVGRQVTAPPDDIRAGIVVLPEPASTATRSKTAALFVDFREQDGRWEFEAPLNVAPDQPFAVIPFGTRHHEWSLALRAPSGEWMPVEERIASGQGARVSGAMPGSAGNLWVEGVHVGSSATPVPGGWRLRVRAPKRRLGHAPVGQILVAGGGTLRLVSHLTTQRLLSDHDVGVSAHLIDTVSTSDAPLVGVVDRAWLRIESSWAPSEVPMFDDGEHGDGDAGDGRFGAYLPRGLGGEIRTTATLQALDGTGNAIVLSGQHAFPILEPAVRFTGQVTARVGNAGSLDLEIGTELLGSADRFHVSAEVWGRAPGGQTVPVAWLSRIASATPPSSGKRPSMTLALDGRWIGRAQTTDGLELRQLRIQDPDTHILFDQIESLPLATPRLPSTAFQAAVPVTQDMLMGPSSRSMAPGADPRTFDRYGNLILAHGYCSGGSIWPNADFSQPKVEFIDADQNRSHDQFAQLLLGLGGRTPSFGVLAHSQGGAAALQLYTYYASGLDDAHGAHRIQTLATPFQGTPLADFGGFACGTNFDLSVAGSAMWLAGIPSWARNEVHYWTTVDAGSACSFLANFILDDNDNDGTTERFRGQLPGGHNMGHIPGWCHTTGMSEPPSYTDGALNAIRNAAAAR